MTRGDILLLLQAELDNCQTRMDVLLASQRRLIVETRGHIADSVAQLDKPRRRRWRMLRDNRTFLR